MKTMRGRGGFSLIELLTVIAIIAILAGIIFPVMSNVKKTAQRTKCMNNMHNIAMALKLFHQDNRKYPDTLAGYVQYDTDNKVIPLERTTGGEGLYPEYIKSFTGLHCALSATTSTSAVIEVDALNKEYYAYSSYEIYSPVMIGNRADGTAADIRYNKRWASQLSDVKIFTPFSSTSDEKYDYKRQLSFRNPPEDTVVTWCSYHSSGNNEKDKIPVLFLDGHCDLFAVGQMQGTGGAVGWRYRVMPNP